MHYSAAFIVSSAAAGTDLLGLQVALKLRIPCRVIIFGSIAEFKRISVSDRGPEWERTFDDVLESAGISDIVVVPPGPDDGISFRSVNDRIFSEAISIRDSERVERIVAVAVWDNKRKSASDFTAEYIGIANRFDIPVISVASL